MMDATQVRYRKIELNIMLAGLIGRELGKFEEETGQSIQGVSVSMAEVTTIGERFPRYMVAGVETGLEL